jgi:Mg-chelatase subunit ChlD
MYFLGGTEFMRSEDNWKIATEFCEEVNGKLNIDAGETRVGELTFADSAETNIKLADSTSLEHVNEEFSALVPPEEKELNLAAGLDAMHDNPEFRAPNKVIVIITDAEDDVPKKGNTEALKYAKACKDAGIRLIIVGVITDRSTVNKTRWKEIVSNPRTDLITVMFLLELDQVADKLTKLLLNGAGNIATLSPRPIPTAPPTAPNDLVSLVIGNSSTLGSEDNFELVQQFSIKLVDMAFDRPNVETAVGVISFAEHAHIESHLGVNRDNVKEAVKRISFAPGQYKVNLNEAFDIFLGKHNYHKYAKMGKTAIIITDAEDNVPDKGNQETLDNAQKLKDIGVRLIIVGIVHDRKLVNIKRWKDIVSNQDTDLVIVRNFKQLPSAAFDVQKLIAPGLPVTGTCPPCPVCPAPGGRHRP